MLALRAGLDARELALDRKVDRLIVAQLEMQERVVLDRAPVPAVERVAADEVDRARDVAPGAFRHHQQHLVGHRLADQRIEFARQIGPAPFARAGVHVEGEESVPDAFGQVAAGEPLHLDAVLERAGALAPDRLALARRERREEIVEGRVAGILPMELLVVALQEAVRAEQVPFGLGAKVTCTEEASRMPAELDQALRQASRTRRRVAPGATSRRGPVAGVNGTETWSLG